MRRLHHAPVAGLAIVLLLAGCGDGGTFISPTLAEGPAGHTLYKPPATGGVVGDWFGCAQDDQINGTGDGSGSGSGWGTGSGAASATTDDCAELDDDGLRFTSDGKVIMLSADGSRLEQGETYCEAGQLGTYTASGSTITLTVEVDGNQYSGDVTYKIEGDRVTFTSDLAFMKNATAVRVSPPRSTGPCQESPPPVFPDAGPVYYDYGPPVYYDAYPVVYPDAGVDD